MEDFSKIKYSPAWYYKRWPLFYNEECYHILSDYSHNPEKYWNAYYGVGENKENEPPLQEEETEPMIFVDNDPENKNKKRKVCDCEEGKNTCEHVVCV